MDLSFSNRKFTRGHQRIADYISKNVDDIPFMVEEDLAQACEVSISTVSRFWAEIGVKNLKEFKQRVKEDVILSPTRKLMSAFEKMSEEGGAAASVLASADYLRQTADRLDPESFGEAVRLIGSAGTVYVYGPGSAESLSALLDFRLTRFGLSVRRLNRGGHELFDSLIHLRENDAIVLFGFVAKSPEIEVLLDFAKERGCKTVLVTDLAVSDMLGQADVSLYTARGQLWEFHSMVAAIAVIETLIVAIGKLREREALANGEKLHELRRRYQKLLPKRI